MLSQVFAMHEHWSPQLVMGASDGVFGVLVTVCRIGGLAPKVRGSASSMDEQKGGPWPRCWKSMKHTWFTKNCGVENGLTFASLNESAREDRSEADPETALWEVSASR